eukprot:scaffold5342_cov104-Cylindrotheca_fusiformis.AAC.2
MSEDHSIPSRKNSFSFFSISSSGRFRDATDPASGPLPSKGNQSTARSSETSRRQYSKGKVLVALIILLATSPVGASTDSRVKDQETKFRESGKRKPRNLYHIPNLSSDDAFPGSASLFNTIVSLRALPLRFSFVRGKRLISYFRLWMLSRWYQESAEVEETEITAREFWQRTIPFVHLYDPENYFHPGPSPGTSDLVPLLQLYPLRLYPDNPTMATLLDNTYSPGAGPLVDLSRSIRKPVIMFTVVNVGTDVATPGSLILHPVYDTSNSRAEDREVVAFAGIRLHWLDYFKNVLTDGEFGVIVVLQSACRTNNISARYRIDGKNAEYLGDSDLHNPKYDGMEIVGGVRTRRQNRHNCAE